MNSLTLAAILLLCSAAHAASDRCLLKPDAGPCEALIPKYFFDPKTKTCKRFIWGGCKGVVPFQTAADCKTAKCAGANPCSLKPDPGPCKASIPKYFFDPITKTCRKFIWGGCQGVVPFNTAADCEAERCAGEDPCSLKPDAGFCRAYIPRYFWNSSTKVSFNVFAMLLLSDDDALTVFFSYGSGERTDVPAVHLGRLRWCGTFHLALKMRERAVWDVLAEVQAPPGSGSLSRPLPSLLL